MPGLSQRGYARHRGVTHRAVQKAIQAGRITPNEDGTIDPERADTEWKANTDPARPPVRPDGGHARAVPGSARSSRNGGGDPDAIPPSAGGYLASRAVREAYRARREKLAFERESAALVPVEEVRSAGFTTGRRVREHLLTIADRIAPLVAGLQDRADCHRVITEEIERALQELEGGSLGWRR